MELKNENFSVYMNTPIGAIPGEDLTPMLLEISINAMFYMGTEGDNETTKKIVSAIKDLIMKDTLYMQFPLHLVIETFHKGSLGELGGTTKFGIRNVNVWLFSVKDKHQKLIQEEKSKEDQRLKADEAKSYKNIQKRSSLYGAAFNKKLEWKFAGLISSEDWDLMTLDKIVALLHSGLTIQTIRPSMLK